MKYYLYCNEPGFEFEKEVDSIEFSDLSDFVEEFFSDEINDCIFLIGLTQ